MTVLKKRGEGSNLKIKIKKACILKHLLNICSCKSTLHHLLFCLFNFVIVLADLQFTAYNIHLVLSNFHRWRNG